MAPTVPGQDGPVWTSLPSARTGERIAHRLATAIAAGEFGRGDRLPSERTLAANLSVSRDSVRAALRQLVADGLLEIRRGRGGGAFVRAEWAECPVASVRRTVAERRQSVETLVDYRILVEAMVARAAAERAREQDRAALRAALAACQEADSAAAARGAAAVLHLGVARATRSARLVMLHERLGSEVRLNVTDEPCAWRDPPGHEALVSAVGAGRAEEAARVAAAHFEVGADAVREMVRGYEAGAGGA